MTESLHRRVRQMRSRAQIRRWEYRQRHHAKGVWYRLRRLLADAQSAFEISAGDAAVLTSEGVRPEPVGAELEPPKTILFVQRGRLERIARRTPLPVDLGAELLGARCIALVRFEDAPATASPR